jgi:hypothetical protein
MWRLGSSMAARNDETVSTAGVKNLHDWNPILGTTIDRWVLILKLGAEGRRKYGDTFDGPRQPWCEVNLSSEVWVTVPEWVWNEVKWKIKWKIARWLVCASVSIVCPVECSTWYRDCLWVNAENGEFYQWRWWEVLSIAVVVVVGVFVVIVRKVDTS